MMLGRSLRAGVDDAIILIPLAVVLLLLLLLCWQEKESLGELFLLLLILLLPLLPLEENVAVSLGNDTSLESCGEKEDETIFIS